MISRLLQVLLILWAALVAVQAADSRPSGADAMRAMRLKVLKASPGEFGIKPDTACPRTYGVLMEYWVDDLVVSLLSLCEGTASLYTTSTFGIIGGEGHEQVRRSAQRWAMEADKYFDKGRKENGGFPYPGRGRVRFYLLSFSGVRMIEEDYSEIHKSKSPLARLFDSGQSVFTELRRVVEKQDKERGQDAKARDR